MENSPPSPVFFKVKKTYELSAPSQNGELSHLKSERKVHSQIPASQQIQLSHTVPPQPQSQSTSSDAGGSESEGGSLPSSYPDEDPERMRHSKNIATKYCNCVCCVCLAFNNTMTYLFFCCCFF